MSDNSKKTVQDTVAQLIEDYKEYNAICEADGDGSAYEDYEKAEMVVERLRERPLSCEIRSSWENIGSELVADEFRIMLGTGGPAYWISGDLDEHGQPLNVKAFHQDWFEPAQVIYLDEEAQTAVSWLADLFYWGH